MPFYEAFFRADGFVRRYAGCSWKICRQDAGATQFVVAAPEIPGFGEPGVQCRILLVTEGFDRIETRGFYGGVHAEEKADAHGDSDTNRHGPQRNGRGE